jgi:hypothetical protein
MWQKRRRMFQSRTLSATETARIEIQHAGSFRKAHGLPGSFGTNQGRSDGVNALDRCKKHQAFAVRAFSSRGPVFSTWFSTFLLKTFSKKTRDGKKFPVRQQSND